MVEESDLKQWRDAGHVARRTLEGIKGEIVAGKQWSEVIDSAERFIRRHGGQAAFPVTISVNDMAAHFTSHTEEIPPEGFEGDMIFQKGDLVKLDVGVHIKGALGDNALTVEVGNGGSHTEQIKAAKEARNAAIEKLHPGTPWHEVGEAAQQVSSDAGFEPIRNLCGHQMERWNLHSGVSIPMIRTLSSLSMISKPKSMSTSTVSPSITLMTLHLYSYIITPVFPTRVFILIYCFNRS